MSVKHIVKGMALAVALLGFSSCSIISQTFGGGNGPLAEARIKKKDGEAQIRDGIASYAREYIGTKYRPAGKSPSSGFDCSGFVYYVMKEFEIQMAASSASQESQGKKITKQDAQPGDLVFFRRSKGGRVFHVAMVLDNKNGDLTLIHSTSRGVVIDRLKDSAYWTSKVMTFRNVVSSM